MPPLTRSDETGNNAMPTIAIDARKWRDYGIGTYVRNLVRHLAHLDRESTYFLFCDPADEATADSATKSHATEIAIPVHVAIIIVLRETNARPSSRARQSSECLVGLWGKPLIRTHRAPISGIFQI